MGGIVRLKIKMLFFLILSHGNPRSTGSFLKFIGIEFLQQNSTVPIIEVIGVNQCCGSGSVLDPYSGAS